MEHPENSAQMLDLLMRPAFSVKDGIVTARNRAAAQYMIEPGCPISQLLATGQEEYAAFRDGCLYLQLSICDKSRGASVTHIDGQDIFLLEDEAETEALQSLALAAKELRAPLSAVLACVDRLFPTLDTEADGAVREQMASINRGLFQMLRIVGNMSDALRYCSESRSNLEAMDIRALIGEIFDRAAALAEEAGVSIRLRNLPQPVYCAINREMLERAIYNLLSNALRSAPKGSCISAEVTRHGKRLSLTVRDCGSGIPADILSSVYTRFLRAPGIEDGPQGIGLGMLLIRSAAAIHGGTVLIRQSGDHGTAITLSITITDPGSGMLRSPVLKIDYAGERDHGLIELSNILPAASYLPQNIN